MSAHPFVFRLWTTALLIFANCAFAFANNQDLGGEVAVRFAQQVLPILSDKCFVCHGPDADALDLLRLDVEAVATGDLGGYRAIDRQHPESSVLLERIHDADDPMPPTDSGKQLTEAEKEILTTWIRQGGPYQQHWSLVAPSTNGSTASQSIDAYILARLEKDGVKLAEEAERWTLARRASFVLIGLPPPQELWQRFRDDSDEGAYERYVDALMERSDFGEHQARYWLDAVRYGDTHGLHLDNRRGIYPYRDWVVRAFNDNLPLDEFLVWQLAGDLLENPTLEQKVATGFVRMNPSTSEGGAIAAEFQAKNSFDRTETFGTILLGMTLTCARCHTHKYDPITQQEYYELLAFFNNTNEAALDGNKYEYGDVVKVPGNQQAWAEWSEWNRAASEAVRLGQRRLERKERLPDGWAEWGRDQRLQWLAGEHDAVQGLAIHRRAQRLQDQEANLREGFTTTLIAQERKEPRETFVLERGEYNLPVGDALVPDIPAALGEYPADLPRNRLGLAQWLVSADNPLTARVMVNRLWQRVFGAGLVRTPEDFGVQGQQPTHPKLLDWLALTLQADGWDQKAMLRRMVTSRVFRQDASWRPDVDDPENRLYARGPSFRLDAEVLRDTALWASGLLVSEMGGEGVKPYQPKGMWKALAHPASNTKLYEQDAGDKLYRKSLYLYWKRTSPHPMMTLFDAPDRESSCVRRSRTNTSLQSLGLLNETQRVEMARKLAERCLESEETDAARIRWVFNLLTCRSATDAERDACLSLLGDSRARYHQSTEDAHALLSVGDARVSQDWQADELAAWTQVCATILASDAVITLY